MSYSSLRAQVWHVLTRITQVRSFTMCIRKKTLVGSEYRYCYVILKTVTNSIFLQQKCWQLLGGALFLGPTGVQGQSPCHAMSHSPILSLPSHFKWPSAAYGPNWYINAYRATTGICCPSVITSSIARNAKLWYISYLEGDRLHWWGWNLTGGGDQRSTSPPPAKFHPHRCNDKGIGPPKLKFLLRFYQNSEYKRTPQGRIPCAIITKFAEFVPRFRMS